ncbi:hypothetical protein AC1031_021514 [Aphanomyces cochlioides]|nr:hypothetical protein AC1031_021514 [Aphanomyces cochlioides]
MSKVEDVLDAESCGGLLDQVKVSQGMLWNSVKKTPVFVVSNPTLKKIYVFDEKKTTVKTVFDTDAKQVFVREEDAPDHRFVLGSEGVEPVVLSAKSSDEQGEWFGSFTKAGASIQEPVGEFDPNQVKSFYELSAVDLNGKLVPFEEYKGRVCVAFNAGSQCGLTDVNYKQFVELDKKYRDQGLQLLAFPSNSFGQETGSASEIQSFVDRYGVTFPVFQKAPVNGPHTQPVFKYLKQNASGGVFGNFIKWNFQKFLIDQDGKPIKRFSPKTTPSEIEAEIVELLKANQAKDAAPAAEAAPAAAPTAEAAPVASN